MRCCETCLVVADDDQFFRDGRRADGFRPNCRDCYYADKACSVCGETPGRSGFYDRPEPQSKCRRCIREQRRVFRVTDSERLNRQRRDRRAALTERERRDRDIRARFNIGIEDVEQMLATQGGGCAICKRTSPGTARWWHIDHDHACCPTSAKSCGGCVRGVLCHKCNLILGHAGDSPDVLLAGIRYLEVASARGQEHRGDI